MSDALVEQKRLETLRECVQKVHRKLPLAAGERRMCQLLRYWLVDPKTRRVSEASPSATTYCCCISPTTVVYLVSRPLRDEFAVVELLEKDLSPSARLLTKVVEMVPSLRGLYLCKVKTLANVPGNPEQFVFNRGYFT